MKIIETTNYTTIKDLFERLERMISYLITYNENGEPIKNGEYISKKDLLDELLRFKVNFLNNNLYRQQGAV